MRHATSRPALLLPILAISWFWLFGFVVVSGLPVLAKDVLVANEQVVTLMLALFAIGVGVGSMLAERLLHGEVSARHVPLAGLMMGLFAVDLHQAGSGSCGRRRSRGHRRVTSTPLQLGACSAI
jgi:acyl-[acyl-carrier-protein]-phospholipid O-acyltransferase/long-chain-fatty-acid--[acyl-carrier-protein] ligase